VLPTTQDSSFSKPNPSPSGSLAGDTHTGKPLLAVSEAVMLPTTQDSSFSKPNPSPSESLAGDKVFLSEARG